MAVQPLLTWERAQLLQRGIGEVRDLGEWEHAGTTSLHGATN